MSPLLNDKVHTLHPYAWQRRATCYQLLLDFSCVWCLMTNHRSQAAFQALYFFSLDLFMSLLLLAR